jgi:hypothetical protein
MNDAQHVLSLVQRQLRGLAEPSGAELAEEGPLACVQVEMLTKIRHGCEMLPALRASDLLLLEVSDIDMTLQAEP